MSAAPESVRGAHLHLIDQAEAATDLVAPAGLDRVEALMRELAGIGGRGRATEMAREHLASGGKRLRARLALATTAALGGAHKDAVSWAAAVELLHNATLVHDDIQDGDVTRRGYPTLWSMHGISQAMNAGDLMLMLPYLAVSRIPSPSCGELSRAIAEHAVMTVCGQVNEIDLLGRESLDWASYRAAVVGKTGALLGLPVHGAALLGGRSRIQAQHLGDAFSELGVLFQLQDDVLDLYGDKERDKVGGDLYEGKISALVVAHLERRPADRAQLLALLRTPREGTRAVDVLRTIDVFVESGALTDTLDRIDAIARDTRENPALHEVPLVRFIATHLVDLATRPIAHCRAVAGQGAHP